MMTYYQLDHEEHFSVKYYLKFESFHSRKCIWKVAIIGHLVMWSRLLSRLTCSMKLNNPFRLYNFCQRPNCFLVIVLRKGKLEFSRLYETSAAQHNGITENRFHDAKFSFLVAPKVVVFSNLLPVTTKLPYLHLSVFSYGTDLKVYIYYTAKCIRDIRATYIYIYV